MRILMFGWEFPPHISGGLGTACLGITESLICDTDVNITLVIPKAINNQTKSNFKLIGANQVLLSKESPILEKIKKNQLKYIQIDAKLSPYLNETDYKKMMENRAKMESRISAGKSGFTINFSGNYNHSLMQEVHNYAILSELISKNEDFDIIHAHDWMTFKGGIKAKEISQKPLIIHVHSTEFDRSRNSINPQIYAIEKEGFEEADRIIAVSNYTKRILVENYQVNPEKITTIHNAVETIKKVKSNFIKKKGEKVVTFLGRITIQKGPEYFIDMANLVLDRFKNVRFVMAGSGDMETMMIQKVARMGISDKFHFTGFLNKDDVDHIFGLTDIFVMPSMSEPFGIVPLEAMQHNVPVIISKQSGVAEIIQNAIKIDFWDIYAMADAVYGLLNYTSLSKHLAQNGKNEVENLTWDNVGKKIKTVYKEFV